MMVYILVELTMEHALMHVVVPNIQLRRKNVKTNILLILVQLSSKTIVSLAHKNVVVNKKKPVQNLAHMGHVVIVVVELKREVVLAL